MVEKYRKKPIEIEAIQFDGNNLKDVIDFINDETFYCPIPYESGHLINVDTLEGTVTCYPGYWLIRGVKGEFYPCRDDVFRMTYEKVNE